MNANENVHPIPIHCVKRDTPHEDSPNGGSLHECATGKT